MDFIAREVIPRVEEMKKSPQDSIFHRDNVLAVELEEFTKLLDETKFEQIPGTTIRYTRDSPMIAILNDETFNIRGKVYGRVFILSEEDSLRMKKFDKLCPYEKFERMGDEDARRALCSCLEEATRKPGVIVKTEGKPLNIDGNYYGGVMFLSEEESARSRRLDGHIESLRH